MAFRVRGNNTVADIDDQTTTEYTKILNYVNDIITTDNKQLSRTEIKTIVDNVRSNIGLLPSQDISDILKLTADITEKLKQTNSELQFNNTSKKLLEKLNELIRN